MSPKRWILLLIFYISYLMFGASIYYHIEHNLEKQQRAEDLKERIEIHSYLVDQLADKNTTAQNEVLERITDYCGKPVTDYTTDEFDPPFTWTFYHSFFFAFTVCSTVGYGNISPSSTLGRMIMIAYSVIGIPINGILFAGLGEYFGRTFQAIYRRYKKYKRTNDIRYMPPKLGLITTVAIALIPGVTLFIFLPAWVFSYFEDWPYTLSIYYSYVTTTTIGFGDYVPTFQADQPTKFGWLFVVYQIFVIVWFIFSLGYLLMIMTFITRGLQSKKLAYLEQQLSTNIKATQNRIWNGVTKDVGYLRRILNELYIMKFKPVYTEPDFSMLHRSNSCPELSMYRVDPPVVPRRQRAFSECYDLQEARAEVTPLRTASDTELDKFDRQKSFETAEAYRHTTGLLAKVVSALATVQAPPDDETSTIGSAGMYGGYHGFSDSQILASEWSFPSITGATLQPPPRRGRACSDFNINPKWDVRPVQNEWTWSGDNNQIQQAINDRVKSTPGLGDVGEDLYRASFARPPLEYIVNMEDEELRKPRQKKFSIPDGIRRLFPFKKRNSQLDMVAGGGEGGADGDVGPERKFSIASVPETQQHKAPPLDYYSTVTANASPSYFRNGQARQPLPPILQSTPSEGNSLGRMTELFPSATALNGGARRGSVYDADQTFQSNASSTYQRRPAATTATAAAASKKRRESTIFAQNPALAARRGSMFPPTSAAAAAALSQRRSSLFSSERRGSVASAAIGGFPARRGSMFPGASRPSFAGDRRPSLFSLTSEEDMNVLENTTLADLIRALEVVHTQAVMEEPPPQTSTVQSTGGGGARGAFFKNDKKKRRKMGSAGLDLPPILSLFAGDDTKTLTTAAANRLYARRATVVGTLPNSSFGSTSAGPQGSVSGPSTSGSILTRRRQSTVAMADPPPSYSEMDTAAPKFKRRFSIRPTALQIPPGQAPPPGVNIGNVLAPSVATPSAAGMSQTALQRRLSLRPSPLARELSVPPTTTPTGGTTVASPTADASPGAGAVGASTRAAVPTSSTRLLPPPGGRPTTTTSSTHSPLSRIVQISQAQRKSSMPDGFALDRNKKPDGGK